MSFWGFFTGVVSVSILGWAWYLHCFWLFHCWATRSTPCSPVYGKTLQTLLGGEWEMQICQRCGAIKFRRLP